MNYEVTLLGQTLTFFPFPPNWKNSVNESLDWKTDVLRAYDGSEQRRALRTVPRRGLEYDFTAKGLSARLFDTLAWSGQSGMFAVPLWMYRSNLTAPCSAGATTIYLDTANLGFVAGGAACVYRSTTGFETFVVDTVSADHVTLQAPLSSPWVTGDRVYPLLLAKAPSSIPTQRHTDSLMTGRVSFGSSADLNDPFIPITAAPAMYDGIEVLTFQPNWGRAIDNTWSHEFATLDSGVGAMRWVETEVAGRISRPYSWLLKSKAQIAEFRAFLGRMRGRAKTCWVPSWHDDFTVTATTAIGGSTITVLGDTFSTHVGVDINRDRLMIKLVDGTILYRKITDMSALGDDTVLQLDAVFAQEVGPANVSRVHLLHHCRLMGDKVEIPWRTDTVADPRLTFITAPL